MHIIMQFCVAFSYVCPPYAHTSFSLSILLSWPAVYWLPLIWESRSGIHIIKRAKLCSCILFNSVSYLFLLLSLCILIDKYALSCILFANWHSPATLTEVYPCFFFSCKTNARVYLAKTGTVRTLPN
jgi:hypothetical protein